MSGHPRRASDCLLPLSERRHACRGASLPPPKLWPGWQSCAMCLRYGQRPLGAMSSAAK